jgi:putative ABC transport system ATP-binding protein
VIKSHTHNQIAVHCQSVTKTYGAGATQVAALRGIDLQVRYGEVFMIVGPSGCGKTTLISVIAAILDQDEGQCEVLGRNIKTLQRTERVRFRGHSIGFVFQVFNLLPALTVQENVSIPLLLNGMPRKHANDKAAESLRSVGLAERRHALPAQLSGGQQQRVAIARALVHDPKLIICDEPTSNLDHKAGHEVMALLRRVAQDPGRALVIVTHDNRILEFADRVAHMDDGKIVGTTSAKGEMEK